MFSTHVLPTKPSIMTMSEKHSFEEAEGKHDFEQAEPSLEKTLLLALAAAAAANAAAVALGKAAPNQLFVKPMMYNGHYVSATLPGELVAYFNDLDEDLPALRKMLEKQGFKESQINIWIGQITKLYNESRVTQLADGSYKKDANSSGFDGENYTDNVTTNFDLPDFSKLAQREAQRQSLRELQREAAELAELELQREAAELAELEEDNSTGEPKTSSKAVLDLDEVMFSQRVEMAKERLRELAENNYSEILLTEETKKKLMDWILHNHRISDEIKVQLMLEISQNGMDDIFLMAEQFKLFLEQASQVFSRTAEDAEKTRSRLCVQENICGAAEDAYWEEMAEYINTTKDTVIDGVAFGITVTLAAIVAAWFDKQLMPNHQPKAKRKLIMCSNSEDSEDSGDSDDDSD